MTKKNFFEEEIRDGYLVTSTMKKVWYVELELLKKFIQVCKKYNLQYYAEGGTLIGVIRHGGFIPWDDDIDIAMPRRDYDKLLKVGPKEFSHPLFFQNCYTDRYYSRGFSRIRNSETTAIALYEVKTKQNKGIFIDIFPLDNVPDNNLEFVRQQKQIKIIKKILSNLFEFSSYENKRIATYIKHFFVKLFFLAIPYSFIYWRLEKLYSKYSATSTAKVSLLSLDHDNVKLYRDSKDYDSFIMMPFEDIQLPVPVGYDHFLRRYYGDYMIPLIEPSYHGKLIFDTSMSYIDYIKIHRQKLIYGQRKI
jgi:lipopolysaccharide cholinephosphotransferase